MIVDLHCHVWPDAIAGRALAGNIPGMDLAGDGTVGGLRAAQDAAGIDYSVCLAVANTPAQVPAANRFAASLDRSRLVPFGTVHPGASIGDNLAALESAGVAGVKLHPVFQGYRLDDPALFELLSALEGRYVVTVHVGEGGGADGSSCTPTMLAAIGRAFPALSLVACHYGGYRRLEEASEAVVGSGVFIDTSWPPSAGALGTDVLLGLVRRHGAERVLFASDWPTASPTRELEVWRAVGLDDDELQAVLGGNAARLLNLRERPA